MADVIVKIETDQKLTIYQMRFDTMAEAGAAIGAVLSTLGEPKLAPDQKLGYKVGIQVYP